MNREPTFELADAHRHFSADCFNRAWDLIEKQNRTPEEDLRMVALSHASLFHWMNRADVTARNLSIGYWQASRVLALVGQPAAALWLAQASVRHADGLDPFYKGYGLEATARAMVGLGRLAEAREVLATARALAAQTADVEGRSRLEHDLAALESLAGSAG
ncbi:MAG TPA: hypothetical protein VG248_04315 [Caulobacteraceae bacterium]|jgi:hypothetical protein|nr:hypothetical protein [Caulobacteraceae bacterium]